MRLSLGKGTVHKLCQALRGVQQKGILLKKGVDGAGDELFFAYTRAIVSLRGHSLICSMGYSTMIHGI